MGKHLLGSVLATLSVWLPLQGLAQSGNADIAPCSLFTASDAQRIVGVPMKMAPPPGGAEFAKFGCSFEPAEPAGPTILVEFVVFHHKSPDREDEMWNMRKSGAASGNKVDTLAGIGDDAFAIHQKIGSGGGLSTSLYVRKGTSDFAMQSNGTRSEPLPAMKEIAKKIADRL